MDEWQGKHEPRTPRAGKSTPDVRASEPDPDSWMPGQSAGTGRDRSKKRSGNESWSHIPTRSVNWMRIRYRAKLAGLALVVILLTGILLYVWINWGNKTQMVIIKPGKVNASWLATTPFMNSITRDSLELNASYLKPIEDLDLLDPESDDWKKMNVELPVGFGGPDGQVMLFYINATGVAYAIDEKDEKESDLIACTLPADVSPFDSDREPKRYSLEALLDRIVACDSESPGTKLVLIDSHPLSTPSNPGLLIDRFPQAVHDLYERKYKNDDESHRLVIVCSHSPGQRNWPAPELDSSVFGFFSRVALLGAADGATGKGQDNKITLDEFCQYLAFHVTGHVSKYRLATQNPMVLAPESLKPGGNAKSKSGELALTYCNPLSTPAESLNESGRNASDRISHLTEKFRLRQKWQVFAQLESSQRLDRDPMLAGRAAALLVRMEQLICELGIDADELVALDSEWTLLIKSFELPVSYSPVSLAEAEWLDQQARNPGIAGNDNPKHLPGREERKSLKQTLSAWVKMKNTPPEKPASEPASSPADAAGNTDSPNEKGAGVDPDDGKAPVAPGETGTAAIEPTVEPDELTKTLLKIESQPALIAAMLWDGVCRNDDFSPSFKNLEYWLSKLDGATTVTFDRLPINEFIEMKFLHLLLQNVNWNSESPANIEHAVRRAVQCRDACENFATHVDPRVLIWVSDEFRSLENARRIGEDYLFADQFETAVELFDYVIEQLDETKPDSLGVRARSLASAFSVRNEVARKSPQFAMLIARQILRNETTGKDVPSGVDFVEFLNRWLSLAKMNHQLAEELSRPSAGIEVSITADMLMVDTMRVLKLAQEVKVSLEFLEGELGKHWAYLADIKSDDIQAMVYIPDLLMSPLVTTRREDLRARYLNSIRAITPDVGPGRSVQPVNYPYTNLPQQEILDFLRSADMVNQHDYFTPLQRSISAKPYRKYWDTTRISIESIDQIGRQLQQDLDQAGSLITQRKEMQTADYWLRCVASGLADYQGNFGDSIGQSSHYFHMLGRTGSALNRIQDSLHTNLKIERILDDFWGNNRLADKDEPYFRRVADRIYDRLASDHRKLLDVSLQPLLASRLKSAREFQIDCDEYKYLQNEEENKPHAFSVRANAELDQRTEVGGMERGPMAIAQIQRLRGRLLSDDPLFVKVPGESGTSSERRIAYDLELLRSGVVPKKLFYFVDDELPTLGYVQAVLAFRGHLADAQFRVRPMDPPPADFLPTISVAHDPAIWRAPAVVVNSEERAVTDVVFVLDCSGSMSGSFRAGEMEGSDELPSSPGSQVDTAVSTTRFQFLKRAILDRLGQMRTSKLSRVGIVAVGSRVKFKKVGKKSLNELQYSDPEKAKQWMAEKIRPNNDADIIAELTSTAVWSKQEWEAIEESITNLVPHGNTPLYAGMLEAYEMLNSSGDNRSQVIVVISDGVEEVYEFYGEYPELDGSLSAANYATLVGKKQLKDEKKNEDKVKVFFVGFDLANDKSESARALRERINGLQPGLFEKRLNEITSLVPKENVYFPNQIQAFRDDLEKIVRASKFEVTHDRQRVAEVKLNQGWRPSSFEEFKPGFYDISIQDSQASTRLWLEDGEFITLGFDGSNLKLVQSRNSGAFSGDSQTQSIGSYDYSISRFQENTERLDMTRFEFLLERIPNDQFSYRPNRLCLEILPDAPLATSPAYVLQDYRFVSKPDQNAPVVQFASPVLNRGSYKLRLWTQPFQESRDSPPGQMSLTEGHLSGRAKALKQEKIIGDDNVAIEAWGDSVEQSITVRLTAIRPEVLRTLLVDLFVKDPPSNARYGIDFPTNRVFAEPVLLLDSVANADSTPVFVEHTFFLDKRYHSLPISFTVRPMNSVFGTSSFADFSYQKN